MSVGSISWTLVSPPLGKIPLIADLCVIIVISSLLLVLCLVEVDICPIIGTVTAAVGFCSCGSYVGGGPLLLLL